MSDTCGRCKHWVKYGSEPRGACHRFPPQVKVEGYQYRPTMKETERACGEFVALPPEAVPEVKAKVLPPEPAYMKDARQQKKGAK